MHVYDLANPMILAFARPMGMLLLALALIGSSTCAQRVERSHSVELITPPAHHGARWH
jgi:hypothetical protein